MRRAILLIVDGCGVGAAPDAEQFGDQKSCNTLANVARNTANFRLPNLEKLGLGNICQVDGVSPNNAPQGITAKLEEVSNGKDTQTGHWEMMGLVSTEAFPTYPNGFPPEIIDRFVIETGVPGILCNLPMSGTDVLRDLGQEHQQTGKPIVYTSGDSVFQIACHVDTIPLAKQYEMCEIARRILDGPHKVGRVICRPFNGKPGEYKRLSGDRRDYAVPPPGKHFMDRLIEQNKGVFGIGKIEDIFVKTGLSHAQHTGSNAEGLDLTLKAINGSLSMSGLKLEKDLPDDVRFIFTNLVDTDALYGHRRDVAGYASSLVEFDNWLGKIMSSLAQDDLLLISSDHGNDPTAPGTDHTREFVPLVGYSPSFAKENVFERNQGVRKGFYDIAAGLSHWLSVDYSGPGKSFLTN